MNLRREIDADLVEQVAEAASQEHGDYAGRAVRHFFEALGSPWWVVLVVPVGATSDDHAGQLATPEQIEAIAGRIQAMITRAKAAGYTIDEAYSAASPAPTHEATADELWDCIGRPATVTVAAGARTGVLRVVKGSGGPVEVTVALDMPRAERPQDAPTSEEPS